MQKGKMIHLKISFDFHDKVRANVVLQGQGDRRYDYNSK